MLLAIETATTESDALGHSSAVSRAKPDTGSPAFLGGSVLVGASVATVWTGVNFPADTGFADVVLRVADVAFRVVVVLDAASALSANTKGRAAASTVVKTTRALRAWRLARITIRKHYCRGLAMHR